MRPVFVVEDSPVFDPLSRIDHRQEPGRMQAFWSQPAVEAFDIAIVRGISWPREVDPGAMMIGPQIDQIPAGLRFGPPPRRARNLGQNFA